MARINLLPWREAERTRRKRDFAIAAIVALSVMAVLALGVHVHIERLINRQVDRNAFLTSEIKEIDKQIREIKKLEETKANLLARMQVIQKLQQSRPEVVHLFDELVESIPEGVFLTKIRQEGNRVTVEGRAQSNARVSAFMRRIEASKWISKPRLLLIEQKDKTGTGLSHFRLRFVQQRTDDSKKKGKQADSRSGVPSTSNPPLLG